MKRTKGWQMLLWLGMGGLNLSALAAMGFTQPTPAEENQESEMVSTFYTSLCHRSPDPATMGYYLGVLYDNRQTPAEVQASIVKTCTQKSQASNNQPLVVTQ